MKQRLIIACLLALPLAGCNLFGGSTDAAVEDGVAAAEGQVMEGTISDAMLNLDGSREMAPVSDTPFIAPPRPKPKPEESDPDDASDAGSNSDPAENAEKKPPRGSPEIPSEEPIREEPVTTEE